MDSSDLTAEQAADLADRIGPMLGYLTRLCARLQQRGSPGSDPVDSDARAAQGAMHRLHLTVRELARLHRHASKDRRPWEPGGSARGRGN